MTIRITALALGVSLLMGCAGSNKAQQAAEPNTLSRQEQKEGWKLLFDGKTKNGWHVYNNSTDGSAWKVADGTLFLDPEAKGPDNAGGGDLINEQEFENYHFKLEWKLTPNGNSGVIFQAQEDKKYRWPWQTGPEMQILDNNGHPDAKIKTHRAGDLYDMISSSPETVKPVGEWNLLEIVADRGKLEFYLNSVKVVSTTQWDDNWRDMIAKSKFKNSKEFGTYKKGKLALQDHGDKVWFRNIKVREL